MKAQPNITEEKAKRLALLLSANIHGKDIDMKLGKATDLLNQIQQQIEMHGDDLLVAFYVGEDTLKDANSSIIGAVTVDAVEQTSPPRLDLVFNDK